jgi:hypothetical protein
MNRSMFVREKAKGHSGFSFRVLVLRANSTEHGCNRKQILVKYCPIHHLLRNAQNFYQKVLLRIFQNSWVSDAQMLLQNCWIIAQDVGFHCFKIASVLYERNPVRD